MSDTQSFAEPEQHTLDLAAAAERYWRARAVDVELDEHERQREQERLLERVGEEARAKICRDEALSPRMTWKGRRAFEAWRANRPPIDRTDENPYGVAVGEPWMA